jgi:hypothetical protein
MRVNIEIIIPGFQNGPCGTKRNKGHKRKLGNKNNEIFLKIC